MTIYRCLGEVQPIFPRLPDRREKECLLDAYGVTSNSWPELNQIECALRFIYEVTLGEALIPERIPYAQEPHKLLVVLDTDEIVEFLEAVSSLKSRAALTSTNSEL